MLEKGVLVHMTQQACAPELWEKSCKSGNFRKWKEWLLLIFFLAVVYFFSQSSYRSCYKWKRYINLRSNATIYLLIFFLEVVTNDSTLSILVYYLYLSLIFFLEWDMK
jgi:hypothetical protein